MAEQENEAIAVSWVSKEDLLYCFPTCEAQIAVFSRTDLERIADKLGDALQEQYWNALAIILREQFGLEDCAAEDEDLPLNDAEAT